MRTATGKIYWFVPAIFLFLVIESVIMPWIIPADWRDSMMLSPHLVLLIVLYGSILIGRYFGLIAGFSFGLLIDVLYYGHMLGLYTSGIAFTALAAGWVSEKLRPTFYSTLLIVFAALVVYDHYIYGIYRLFNIVSEFYTWALLHYILPSTILNLFISLLLYIPLRQWVERLTTVQKETGEP